MGLNLKKSAGVANKILKKEPSQQYCNEEFETPDTFLLVPRPSAPPLFRVMILEKKVNN